MAREIHGNIFYRYIKLAGCNSTGKSMSLNPMFSTEGTSHTFSMVGRGKVRGQSRSANALKSWYIPKYFHEKVILTCTPT